MKTRRLACCFVTLLGLVLITSSQATVRAQGSVGAVESAPPSWPDAFHVMNGCYLSTAAYLHRLGQEHPEAAGEPATVSLPSGGRHTFAWIRWDGAHYIRDKDLGVIHAGADDPQTCFLKALRDWERRGGPQSIRERWPRSVEERRREIARAAALVAFLRPKRMQVQHSKGSREALWWRTAAGELAIYEPSLGTAVGRTQRTPVEVVRGLLQATRDSG